MKMRGDSFSVSCLWAQSIRKHMLFREIFKFWRYCRGDSMPRNIHIAHARLKKHKNYEFQVKKGEMSQFVKKM